MPKLIIRLGGDERTEELSADVTVLGRSAECTIPLPHKSLSRRHCEVRRAGDGFVVADCGSLNGTVVNGKKIEGEHRLAPGDRIDVGIAHVFFERVPDRPTKVKPAPPAEAGTGAARDEEPTVVPVVEGATPPAYAAWSRRGLRAGWAVGVGVAAGVVALGALALRVLLAPSGPAPDTDNLLKENPSFEAAAPEGIPPGWTVPLGTQSLVRVQRGEAKDGQRCLEIEKAAAPGEFVFSCAAEKAVELAPKSTVAVTGWVRAQGLKGYAALRCVARAAPARPHAAAKDAKDEPPALLGMPVAQFYSAPVEGTTGWQPVSIEFMPPTGARQATLECVVAGPEGRAQFDGLRIVARAGEARPDAAVAFDFKSYTVLVQPGGAFHLFYRPEGGGAPKWVLAGARVGLRTAHGAVDQGFAPGRPPGETPARDKATGAVTLKTSVLHPGSLQWIPVKETLYETEGEFRVGYEFPGEGPRAEDELVVEASCPLAEGGATARVETEGGEQAADLSDLAARGAVRFLWSSGDLSCTARYPYPVALAGGRRGDLLRIEQAVETARAKPEPVPGAPETGPAAAVFGLGLTVTLQRELGSLKEALDGAAAAEAAGRYGEAAVTCRRVMESAHGKREVATEKDAERRLRELEARVKLSLADVRRVVVAARLLGDPAAAADAERMLDALAERCKGSPWAADADALRGELEQARAQASADAGRDGGAQAFRLAEYHVSHGDKALGRVLIEHILHHCKSTPWAAEAEKLKERLESVPEGGTTQGKNGT